MSSLADVRPMTINEVQTRLAEIVDSFRAAGLTVAQAQGQRYELTPSQRAELDEYEDFSLIISDVA